MEARKGSGRSRRGSGRFPGRSFEENVPEAVLVEARGPQNDGKMAQDGAKRDFLVAFFIAQNKLRVGGCAFLGSLIPP